MLESFSTEAALAVDTEANSLHAYQEQVCLIQISTLDTDYIVDPLALKDISPLGEVFANPNVEKIFHASEYDINILADDFGFRFANLFDTMLVARILGLKKLGLDSLLDRYFDVQVNKRYQKADWGRRPLPEGMIRYAQLDTHYLIDLRNLLARKLTETNRWEIAREDFQRACWAHERPSRRKLPPRWRGNGPQSLSPQKAAVYRELCEYRDRVARKRDLPLFKVFSSRDLLTLSEQCPRSKKALRSVFSNRMVERHGENLLAAIRKGMEAEPFPPPHTTRPSSAYLGRLRALKEWRKTTARKWGVNSSVVLPRYLLDLVAKENPQTLEDLKEVLSEVPWRVETLGKDILRVLKRP
jgi:ribonuclease D